MADMPEVPGLLDRFTSGFNEFLSPTRVPEGALYDPQSLQMARAALLGNLGATLLSASQKGQSFDQRAQTLGQLGKAPEAYAAMLKGGSDDIYKRLQIMQLKADLDRQKLAEGWIRDQMGGGGGGGGGGQTPASAPAPMQSGAASPVSGAYPEAGAPAPTPGAGAGGMMAAGGPAPPQAQAIPVANAGTADNYRLPPGVLKTLMLGGMKPTEIAKMQAEQALKQESWVPLPVGDSPLRKQLGLPGTQPAAFKMNPQGQVIDYKLLGEDPEKPPAGFRVKGQTLEPIPGGPAQQLAAETAGRVGLATGFLARIPELQSAIDAGKLTSATARAQIKLGIGSEATHYYRTIQEGADALQRGLTGAGMSIPEAAAYAERYLPTLRDDATSMKDKLAQLEYALNNVNTVVTQGRGGVPAPAGSPPPNPYAQGAAPARPQAQAPARNEPIIYDPDGVPHVVRNGKWVRQ